MKYFSKYNSMYVWVVYLPSGREDAVFSLGLGGGCTVIYEQLQYLDMQLPFCKFLYCCNPNAHSKSIVYTVDSDQF